MSVAAWIDNSRILWRAWECSSSAPSATCAIDKTSAAFLIDISSALIVAVILSLIAAPAASSPALLILLPEEILSIAVSISLSVLRRLFIEAEVPILVFIPGILYSLRVIHIIFRRNFCKLSAKKKGEG